METTSSKWRKIGRKLITNNPISLGTVTKRIFIKNMKLMRRMLIVGDWWSNSKNCMISSFWIELSEFVGGILRHTVLAPIAQIDITQQLSYWKLLFTIAMHLAFRKRLPNAHLLQRIFRNLFEELLGANGQVLPSLVFFQWFVKRLSKLIGYTTFMLDF